MKKHEIKKIIAIIILLLLAGCAALDSLGQSTSDFLEPVPKNVKDAAMAKVNQETELYGISSASIGDSGLDFAAAKATVNAKNSLRNSVRTETNMNFNSFMLNMDSYTKKIYTPIIPDLVNYTVEIEVGKAVEKGAWDDGKKAYSLVTVQRESVFQESKKTFATFTDKLSERIKNAKASTQGATLPEKSKPTSEPKSATQNTKGTPNLEIEDSSESSDTSEEE